MATKNSNIITHDFKNTNILQRPEDGYLNATAMCKAADKKLNDYTRNSSVQEFFEVLSGDTGIPASELIQVVKGGNGKQGTWVHPKVSIHLAQWLSPQFAVQVTNWVYDWMMGKATQGLQPISETISAAQQHELQVIVAQRAGTADDYGKRRMYIWSRFNNHFKLAGYKQLPTSRFGEAVDYLLAMPTKWQLPAQNLPALPDQTTNHLWLVLNGSGQVVESVTLTDAAVLRGQVDKHFSAQALLDRGAVIGDMDSLTDIMHEAMAKMRNTLNPLVTVLGTATNATQADADAF